jgi:hypothetical protein
MKCRYRDEIKKTQLCHTLNGSALALPRIVAALLENNQTPDGIRIPKALIPYTGFMKIQEIIIQGFSYCAVRTHHGLRTNCIGEDVICRCTG